MISNKKSQLVKESNAVARATLRPVADSVWTERIISQIIAMNQVNDKDFNEHEITIGELVNKKNVSVGQRKEIEKACIQLIQSYFEVKKDNDFSLYPIFSIIEFKKGKITGQLNPKIKPYFLQLQSEFTLLSLPEFKSLSSIYSQQIFRFLSSWSGYPQITRPISELHRLTSAPDSFQVNFKDFRRRVLDVATKEINAKTSLKFDWEPIKTGRKVTAVRFVFGQLGVNKLEKTRRTGEKKTEKEILLELQTESIRCWEKHHANGKTCKPRKTVKRCEYCTTRGKMSFKKIDPPHA